MVLGAIQIINNFKIENLNAETFIKFLEIIMKNLKRVEGYKIPTTKPFNEMHGIEEHHESEDEKINESCDDDNDENDNHTLTVEVIFNMNYFNYFFRSFNIRKSFKRCIIY